MHICFALKKVLYEESKKRFDEDAKFRERTQQVQDWDERHEIAWVQMCKISRERYQKVYQRLGVHAKEEDKSTHDFYICKTKGLLRKQGLTIESEGDEVIFFEGRKLPLVDLAALWHALEKEKATAAKSAGLIVTNNADDPLSHVGFGLVQDKAEDKDLEHTAEALGYGAVKYADLKNNSYTFSFNDMLNEK
ncbi:arginine--tRNA ligase, chloroplastic/mitochondrial-like protein isoform X2, partial [Tanacetum coccineum]